MRAECATREPGCVLDRLLDLFPRVRHTALTGNMPRSAARSGVMPRSAQSNRTTELRWQLRVELLDVSPRVWRRLLVPETITLPKLDRAIQAAVRWTKRPPPTLLILGVS